ncbi:MAG TPA: DUF3667 domain-containing protein [Chitinophagaceae bacterium]
MSHQPERTDKNCLNCGATVQGRYCHICGQENIVPKQSFLGLTKHFVYDIFHFDGKFFETLRLLFFKPGTVSKEYVKGRRMRYLDHIRMYLFTSAIFFLVFFSIESMENVTDLDGHEVLSKAERLDLAMEVSDKVAQNPGDTLAQLQMKLLMDSTYVIGLAPPRDTITSHSLVHHDGMPYKMIARKDTALTPFRTEAKGWFAQTLQTKWNKFEEKYKDDLDEGYIDFLEGLLHKLPYLLFLSLPFFAGILKLLNWRHKETFFSDHAVFTLHHYIISFILILFYFGFDALKNTTGWRIFGTLGGLIFVLWPLYLLIGMKRFYGQPWRTTLGKFLLVNLLGLLTLGLLLLVFILFSIIQL